MKKKEQIEDLSLEWDSCTAQESQHLVLEHLQPSTNLKKPTIKFYGGIWFLNWLGNSSFANMVYLCIRSCHYCSLLPPVEQLHNLKELIIFDIISVKTIGHEFYRSCSPSFQSFPLGSLPVLKWLYFIECKNLKSFSISEEDAPQYLTFLQGFYILECPELESFPHLGLPAPKLRRFWVSYCNKLNSLPGPVNALVGLQELTVLNLPSMQFFANEANYL
ncbi:putative disease resistance protein At3g14460 [Arachis stenosperma]|uniref:putative disease resistance protein At3g14460 n=1 Tax=Arachis stenosperma TaxID=217475 RepID=UPI0025AC53E3|nr:putative disease resistance protein At3g14460 [Arachis stenosperma]